MDLFVLFWVYFSDIDSLFKGKYSQKNKEIFNGICHSAWDPPPLMALISIHFYPTFFLLQLNLPYIKRILHLVNMFILNLRPLTYNLFKIDNY